MSEIAKQRLGKEIKNIADQCGAHGYHIDSFERAMGTWVYNLIKNLIKKITEYSDDEEEWAEKILNLLPKPDLNEFHGNKLTSVEKYFRLKQLEEEIREGLVDEEIIPYLKKINSFEFICTTQSCYGHDKEAAHFDFRCNLDPEWVIDNFLKPLSEKFNGLHFNLYGLHNDRLRYCIWIHWQEYGYNWDDPIKYFIKLLNKYSGSFYPDLINMRD